MRTDQPAEPSRAKHPAPTGSRIGVLLLNLGTPDATDYWSVRRYLSEFLSDSRVIETPAALWQPILQGIVLTTRPQKSGANYARIWDNAAGDSPLRVITRRQVEKLEAALSDIDGIVVDFAMRYGNPSTASRLEALQKAGCQRILLVPLYPQYSATTTATANDKAFLALAGMRWQPAVRTAPAFYDQPAYIAALAESVIEGLKGLDFTPELILTSYHGMPREYLEKGDPYYYQCLETTRLLAEELGWGEGRLMVTFQSRFGRAEWIEPYTDETLKALPGKGIRKVAVMAPAFSVDCIETLEEIAITGREEFLHAGGTDYGYLPCLNDSVPGMRMLEDLVRRELGGWI